MSITSCPKYEFWSPQEISFLKDHYSDCSNDDLQKLLKRDKKRIINKAQRLGLHKCLTHLQQIHVKTSHEVQKEKHLSYFTKKGIYSEPITIWICGLISTDGCVREASNFKLELVSSVDDDWVKAIDKILSEADIRHTISKSDSWRIYLSNYETLRLYHSIKRWKLEQFIMERKLSRIEAWLEEGKYFD